MWKLHQWKMLKSNFISNKQEKHLKWIFRRKSKHKMSMLIFHHHSPFSRSSKKSEGSRISATGIGYIPRWNHSCVELGLPFATDWCLPGSHAPLAITASLLDLLHSAAQRKHLTASLPLGTVSCFGHSGCSWQAPYDSPLLWHLGLQGIQCTVNRVLF